MDPFVEILAQQWNDFLVAGPRLLSAVLIVVLSYYVGIGLGRLLVRLLKRFADRRLPATFFRTLTVSLSVFVGILVALDMVGLEHVALSLVAGGGVTAIVLGFAFREVGENLLAGIFLAFSRPFNLGDTIKTEEIEGVVKAIDLRSTHLRTVDGRDVFVPSAQLFSRPVTNFTRDGLRRFSFDVGIDYSHDAEKACALLMEALWKVEGPLDDPRLIVNITGLLPNYVQLTVFYWIDVFQQASAKPRLRDRLMNSTRETLIAEGYTVSANVSTAVDLTDRRDTRDESGNTAQ